MCERVPSDIENQKVNKKVGDGKLVAVVYVVVTSRHYLNKITEK